ncbi:hypothetical protein [Streptomyces sp. NPDC059894]|uniref:hypothetical protein n=1 Tax=unclassified Streptomyces TaxID=2593676 RepID=UPI00365F2091
MPLAGAAEDIACDESGSDGENLTGGNTPVFAHASVRMPKPSAEGGAARASVNSAV